MRIKAALYNADHMEYGLVTIPFPIPRDQYDDTIKMLEALDIGDPLARDCTVEEIVGSVPSLKCLEGRKINVDELDYLVKRLDSFSDGELAQFQGMAVCLPDSTINEEGRMDEIRLALRELKVKTVQKCHLLDVRCSLPELSIGLDEYQDLTDLIYDGNDLGFVLQEQGQGEPRFLEKFRAALEYEQCHDLKLALDIAGNLNCYDYCPASETEQFGEEALRKQGDSVFRDPVLQGGIDLKAYGEAQLEQQGYLLNTAETGYIRRNGQEFHHERTEPQPEFGMTM